MSFIAQRLECNPLILEMDRSTQLTELLVEPFKSVAADGKYAHQSPMLIVLDGLDECRGEEAQCELARLIGKPETAELPLLWMICSRPEWHLTRLLLPPMPVIHSRVRRSKFLPTTTRPRTMPRRFFELNSVKSARHMIFLTIGYRWRRLS
jgi:hypothetical protein